MAKLTYVEKNLLEKLLGMSSGYVLDFTDATYAAFFQDLGINIEHDRYHKNGRSKAKRMRAFWELGSDLDVGHAIKSLIDYVKAANPNEAGEIEAHHHEIYHRLLGTNETKQDEHTEIEFLATEFGELDLNALALNPALENAVKQRFDEINICLTSKAPLAAILLTGSTLEALLLNTASNNPRIFNQSNSAPRDSRTGQIKQFHHWSLNNLINVASEVGKLGLDVKKFSHALRDFRNYIHPNEQALSGFNPNMHTAKISWQVLQAAIADLSRDE